jgi:hypothetical protein
MKIYSVGKYISNISNMKANALEFDFFSKFFTFATQFEIIDEIVGILGNSQ